MKYFKRIITILYFVFFTNDYSFSFENFFLILKNDKVNVRYGPSFDYPIKFIYKKISPVEIIDKKENFRRIIDHKKNSGWIHISITKIKILVTLKDINMFKKHQIFKANCKNKRW